MTTTILAIAQDAGILERWAGLARDEGYRFAVLSAEKLRNQVVDRSSICLFDLGSRPAASTPPLFDALKAHPALPVIALTAVPEAGEGLRLLRAGVRGYCNRLASPAVLKAVIATVAGGEIWAGRQVTDHLLQAAMTGPVEASQAGDSRFDTLTPRELEMANQVAAGHSNKVIAIDAGISERTVKAHLNAIFRKTGLHNRVQLALALADRAGEQRQQSNG